MLVVRYIHLIIITFVAVSDLQAQTLGRPFSLTPYDRTLRNYPADKLLHLGTWSVHGALSLTMNNDSNVSFDNSQEVRDTYYVVNTGVDVMKNSPKLDVTLSYRYLFQDNQKFEIQNGHGHDIFGLMSWNFSPHFLLYVESGLAINPVQVNRELIYRGKQTSHRLKAGLKQISQSGRTQTELFLVNTLYDAGEDQNQLGYDQQAGTLNHTFALSRAKDLSLTSSVEFTRLNFDQGETHQQALNTSVGLQVSPFRTLTLFGHGGWSWIDVSSAASAGTEANFNLRSDVELSIIEKLRIRLGYQTGSALSQFTGSYEHRTWTLDLKYSLLRSLTLLGQQNMSKLEYGEGQTDTKYDVSSGLNYRWSKGVSNTFSYHYTHRVSNFTHPQLSQNATYNKHLLSTSLDVYY